MKKITSLLLAILILLSAVALAACSSKEDPPAESGTNLPATDTTPDSYEETIPDLDCEGDNFNLLVSTQMQDFFLTTEAQDAVSLASYERNLAVENRFNVTLNYTTMNGNTNGATEFLGAIRAATASGTEDCYDVVVPQLFGLSLVLEGGYHNLYNSKYLHFNRDWWYSNINNYGVIDGKLYGVAGAFNMDKITATVAMFFNKNMATAYGIDPDDIYELVEAGTWSMEDLLRMSALVADNNVDGNSVLDEFDKYGFVTTNHGVRATLVGLDMPVSKVSDDGVEILYMNDRYYRIFDEVYAFFNETDSTYMTTDYELPTEIFSNGRALFYACDIVHISGADFRSLSFEYGVAPMPKYSDEQKEYVSSSMRWDLTFVPIAADFDRACIILENLNYETYNIMIPQYWELAVPYKYMNDPRNQAILETIRQSVYWDFCEYWNSYASGAIFGLGNLIVEKDTGASSWWGANTENVKNSIAEIVQYLNEFEG